MSIFLCPNYQNSSYPISGVYGDDIDGQLKYYNIYFHRCQNYCKDSATIEKYLQSVYLDTVTVDYTTQSLTLVPYVPNIRPDRHAISSSVYIRIWMSLQSVLFRSDMGYIFQDFKEDNYYQFDKFNRDVDLRDQSTATVPGSFCVLTLSNSSSKVVYTRSFTKAQNALASIGGIVNSIIIIAKILYFLFFRKLIDMELLSFVNFKHSTVVESLELSSAKFKNSPRKTTLHHIFQSREKKESLNLKGCDYILPYNCINSKQKLKTFEKGLEYVDSLLDVKNFMRSQEDLFKLRNLILSKHENHLLSSLPIKLLQYTKEINNNISEDELAQGYRELTKKDNPSDLQLRLINYFEQ